MAASPPEGVASAEGRAEPGATGDEAAALTADEGVGPAAAGAEPGPPAVFNHVGQCVTDLERAKRFYVELLGFDVDREIEVPDTAVGSFLGVEPPVGLTVVYLRLGEFQLELLAYDRQGNPEYRPRVLNEPGLTHVSLSVPDLDVVVDRVGDLGGTIVTRHRRSVFLRDPDGQLIEVIERDRRLGT